MDNKQITSKNVLPKISIFDKKAKNNSSKFGSAGQSSQPKHLVNTPQFRLNQHKGA